MKKINTEGLRNVSGGLILFPDGILTRDPRNDDTYFLFGTIDGKEANTTAGRKYAPSGLIEENDIQMTALGPDPNIHTS